jgi:hypothetical protein
LAGLHRPASPFTRHERRHDAGVFVLEARNSSGDAAAASGHDPEKWLLVFHQQAPSFSNVRRLC